MHNKNADAVVRRFLLKRCFRPVTHSAVYDAINYYLHQTLTDIAEAWGLSCIKTLALPVFRSTERSVTCNWLKICKRWKVIAGTAGAAQVASVVCLFVILTENIPTFYFIPWSLTFYSYTLLAFGYSSNNVVSVTLSAVYAKLCRGLCLRQKRLAICSDSVLLS